MAKKDEKQQQQAQAAPDQVSDQVPDQAPDQANDPTPPTPEQPKTVAMKRAPNGSDGPLTADVHPDEVEAWRLHGWHLATE